MQLPLQISFHGISSRPALRDAVAEKAAKLEQYHPHIASCRVVLSVDARHKRHGKQVSVHIDLKVPGAEIAIVREHDEDLQVALRDAFNAARRKLQDHARRQRGDVKQHARA